MNELPIRRQPIQATIQIGTGITMQAQLADELLEPRGALGLTSDVFQNGCIREHAERWRLIGRQFTGYRDWPESCFGVLSFGTDSSGEFACF
jgi:hypothetical protein